MENGKARPMDIKKFLSQSHDLVFQNIHGSKLIYNACWEDPRVDRQLLRIGQGRHRRFESVYREARASGENW
jgi:S-adenosylmethionine:diacylglycerol 3-amino-3-carboxypropyl transferase